MERIRRLPTGVGERMQYLAHEFNDTTIRFLLRYPGSLSPEIMGQAVYAVAMGVDVLHGSFHPGGQSAHWKIYPQIQLADCFAYCACDGDPMKPGEAFALQPIRPQDHCQIHVTLVQGSGECCVVVRMSHLVVDGRDGIYLLRKLAEAYCRLARQGTWDGLEMKNGSRSPREAYRDLSGKELRKLAKLPFQGVKNLFPFAEPQNHGALRFLRCTIPEEVLTAARKKAKIQGATGNDLLLTGCYRSFAREFGVEGPMRISAMMDLRIHCPDGDSKGLSNLSGGLSTALDMDLQRTFSQDLAILSRQTRAAKEDPLAGLEGIPLIHTGIQTMPMWLLLQLSGVVYGSMSLGMTNLGNLSSKELAMGEILPTEGVFGGPLKRKPAVQVACVSLDGTCQLTVLGDLLDGDVASVQQWLDGIREEIQCYLEEM